MLESIQIPPFDPAKYKGVKFLFMEAENGESYLNTLGRDDIINNINTNIHDLSTQKYRPIIISTSRGMGKTFLLKVIGMQKLKPELKSRLIENAISCGRVISYNFGLHSIQITKSKDAKIVFN